MSFTYNLKSCKRKKHQRWLNRYCRKVNKAIANDPLWLGRFVVEQVKTTMEWFDDKSGGLMYCVLRFRDKKTGTTKLWYTDALEVDSSFGWALNDFIVKDCKVWENEHPYQERFDYRNL